MNFDSVVVFVITNWSLLHPGIQFVFFANGRGNDVLARGPFAQVARTATLATEWELRIRTLYRLLANRAPQSD
jgi:hypothetical protein